MATKKISFGKVDGYHNGRKCCEVVLEVGFSEFKGQEPYFTVSGRLWNHIRSDIIQGGQCVDDLAEEFKELASNERYMKIVELWKGYHLKRVSQIPADALERINAILSE